MMLRSPFSYRTPVVMRDGKPLTPPGAKAPIFSMRDRRTETVTRVAAPPVAGKAEALPGGVNYDEGIRLEAAEPNPI